MGKNFAKQQVSPSVQSPSVLLWSGLGFRVRIGREELAYLAYTECMARDMIDNKELTVTEARDNFSQLVNRAAFGGEVTFVHRGRNHEAVAAIVPADLVEQYEAFLDQEDGRIAMERLADLEAGRTTARPWEDAKRDLGL